MLCNGPKRMSQLSLINFAMIWILGEYLFELEKYMSGLQLQDWNWRPKWVRKTKLNTPMCYQKFLEPFGIFNWELIFVWFVKPCLAQPFGTNIYITKDKAEDLCLTQNKRRKYLRKGERVRKKGNLGEEEDRKGKPS